MKQFYLCQKTVAESRRTIFKNRAHYIELPDGFILLTCDFGTDEHTEHLWVDTPGVELLPHPNYESTVPIDHRHAHMLREQGVQAGDTIVDVSIKATKHHPHMRVPRFRKQS